MAAGQTLSTRRDLLPDDIADALSKLQDRVTPFDTDTARAEIERGLGVPIKEAFAHFEDQPLASASIAQVHAATLHDGSSVVVKVLRPNMREVIKRDLGLMYRIARLAEKYWSEGPRLRPVEVVAEYEKTTLDELDLVREAANGAQLRRNFLDSDQLYVPEMHFDLCRENVLVVERIEGVQISNIAELRARGVNFEVLANHGVDVFFRQVFRDNFFHADMHPGNVFVDTTTPDTPRYIAVDFGIVGALTFEDRRYLAENLVAFFHRDYDRVASLHVESGWVPEHTRIEDFASAIRSVCEPIFEKPLAEISFGLVLLRLFQTARRFEMQVQPQLILLQKTLLHIEGLGRQLYPELDLWKTAKPYLERWLSEQVGPRAMVKRLRAELPRYGEVLPELPGLMHAVLKDTQADRRRAAAQAEAMQALQLTVQRGQRVQLLAVLGVGSVLAAVILAGFAQLAGEPAPPAVWLLGGFGVCSAAVALLRR
ncbi:MAG: ubiquinone biosynthesis regulatory protein kinase UbiB [Pseudomonadota bacterium]